MTAPETYWGRFSRDWNLLGPPLRPCSDDIQAMELFVRRWCRSCDATAPQAAILGVTPEIVDMSWSGISRVTAFDNSPEMIRHLFMPRQRPGISAVCANWLSLPLHEASCSVVAGDGSLVLLSFPFEYRTLAHELARVLAPGGILILRVFILPPEREDLDVLFENLWAGSIGNFNAFKWRLLMSLQQSPESGVCVGEAWKVWDTRVPSPEKLSAALGWPLPVIKMIDNYKGDESTCYTYPRFEDLCDVFSPHFSLTDRITPSYEDGERYPTLCFTRV